MALHLETPLTPRPEDYLIWSFLSGILWGQGREIRVVSQVNSPYLLLVREGHNTSKHTIYVTPPEGPNVNRALVEQGWCWWDRKYAP